METTKKTGRGAEVAALKARLAELGQEMASMGPLMRGSLVVIGTRNKQPYFSLNKDGKTKLIYLGKRREGKAREYSANYHRLLAVVEEMTAINMAMVKLDACD
jgi:hypothetical protein